MNQEPKPNPDEIDRRLDAALERLRHEPVPPMPGSTDPHASTLTPAVLSAGKVGPRRRLAPAVLAIAASLVLVASVYWILAKPGVSPTPPNREVAVVNQSESPQKQSPVTESSIALAEPLDALLTKVDQLELELMEMERFVSRLDARQQADRLVADFAPIRDAL